jgi:hypothetical protein
VRAVTGPHPWLIPVTVMVLAAGACVATDDRKTADRPALRTVTLPDLSRLEESVQAQLRERFGTLSAKQNDPATSADDLAT